MSFPIFDGHNDVLARLWLSNDLNRPAYAFLTQMLPGQMDLKRCQQAGMVGGMFAIFIPPFDYVAQHAPHRLSSNQTAYSRADLMQICMAQMAYALEIETQSNGLVKICRTVSEIQSCIENQLFAMILHLEGADAFDDDLHALDVFYAAGLRSIGPLWNLPSQFGHGLQAKFPHSPNTGSGLTELGKHLVTVCQDKHMVVDVSHMNEHAFWDTAEILTQPLVATHSNVHAICPQARNLLDAQLQAIRQSHGFVGVNFDTAFLRKDGQRNAQTEFAVMFEHIDYLIDAIGVDGVGFGSDYDGGFMSEAWSDVSKMPNLLDALSSHGYSDQVIRKLCYQNWLGVLQKIWQ
ncbi:dipeptidase [Acinetobacter apis]|uniref:Membrane dipeptidase n=1 Tax=Acinetobacter apis TaxID=1229165 RepID=A0A217EEM2_9GAMM|nr:dipeptidase [Acinetobacter apis]SNQ28777.1 membrane dipeptidase [Acinetobacter apis]